MMTPGRSGNGSVQFFSDFEVDSGEKVRRRVYMEFRPRELLEISSVSLCQYGCGVDSFELTIIRAARTLKCRKQP